MESSGGPRDDLGDSESPPPADEQTESVKLPATPERPYDGLPGTTSGEDHPPHLYMLEPYPAPVYQRFPALKWLVIVVAVVLGGFGIYRWTDSPNNFADTGVLPPAQPSSGLSGPRPSTYLLPIEGDGIVVRPGASQSLAVRALGDQGAPLADTLVRFRVVEGTGILVADTVRTDSEGLARTSLQLPFRAGVVVVMADLVGSGLPPVPLRISARAGPPRRLVAIAGDQQTATVGTMLPRSVAVRVTDDEGNPVEGTEVRFEVILGEGGVTPTRARTDSLGRAVARWRLGDTPGPQHLMALAPEAEDALLTFSATGQPLAVPEEKPEPADAATPPPPPLIVLTKAYAVGGGYVCYIDAGSAVCRGADDRGQRGTTSTLGLRALAAGVSHVCGLDDAGTAYCWGANESGQLGDGSQVDRSDPSSVGSELRFSSLVTGLSNTCGLLADGRAACWGRSLNGQLGDGTRQDRVVPQLVSGDVSFQSLTAGWNHICGLEGSGVVFCWGLNADGQIGDGSRIDRLVPARVTASFQSLVAGSDHTCGISESQVLCWGDNAFGQLGDGTTEDRLTPVLVRGLPGTPERISAGAVHTCALLQDGSAYCWGQNLSGQLGDGTTQNRSGPTAVVGGVRFATLEAGGALTCGFARAGPEYCWGLNQSGQIGDGTRTNRSSPTRVTLSNSAN